MGQKQLDVSIQLSTTITEDDQKESTTNDYNGRFLSRGSVDVLIYEEKADDNSIIRNLLTIQPDKANIKRSGAISMNQQFIADGLTESFLEHPHGRIHLETHTNTIKYDPLSETSDGKLLILYTVKLNGQQERNHKLKLIFKKREAE